MTTRDIQHHVEERYGIEVSASRVSAVTDAVACFDALRVKLRAEGVVRNKAVYLAIGLRCSGHKASLGLGLEQTGGATFWLKVMNALKQRGTQDIRVAVVDGLKGFPEALEPVCPATVVQTCIVQLICDSWPGRTVWWRTWGIAGRASTAA